MLPPVAVQLKLVGPPVELLFNATFCPTQTGLDKVNAEVGDETAQRLGVIPTIEGYEQIPVDTLRLITSFPAVRSLAIKVRLFCAGPIEKCMKSPVLITCES